MAQGRWARRLSWISAVMFLLTGALHLSAYGQVMGMAEGGSTNLRGVLAVLWVSAFVDLVIFGLIVAAVTIWPFGRSGPILALAASSPLGVAVLQATFLGFIPPAFLLFALAALTLVAAALRKGEGA